MLAAYRYAFRLLWKSPGFTLPAILVLGLGIGANTAIFSLFNGTLLRPLPYPSYTRLFYIWECGAGFSRLQIPFEIYSQWKDHQQSFSSLSIFVQSSAVFAGGRETEQLMGSYISADYFKVLGIAPIVGRYLNDTEDKPGSNVVVLSERIWRRLFNGNPGILGQSISLDNRSFLVIGVAPKSINEAVPWAADFYLSIYADAVKDRTMASGNHIYTCLARLKPKASTEQALIELSGLLHDWKSLNPGKDVAFDARMEPMLDFSVGQYKSTLWLLGGAVCCVLIIACANVANLLFAKSTGRLPELAIRLALGARRREIFAQLLAENFILAVLGAIPGVFFSMFLSRAIRTLAPVDAPRFQEVNFDFSSLLFVIACTIATALLFGTLPAWRSARDTLPSAMKAGVRQSASKQRIQAVLVIAQIVIASILLTSAGLLIRTFQTLQNTNLGFEPRNLLVAEIDLDETRYATDASMLSYWSRLLERVGGLPGVQAVALNWNPPFVGDGPRNPFTILGRPDPETGKEPFGQQQRVSSSYFSTMGIQLKQGRLFDGHDNLGSEDVVVIDEHLAQQYFPNQDPIGMKIGDAPQKRERRLWTIVGIVSTARHDSMGDEPETAQIYYPIAEQPTHGSELLVRCSLPPESLTEAVRRAVLEIDPLQPITQISTLEQALTNKLATRRLSMTVVTLLSCSALALATVGLYAILSYAVAQRRREIGIRIAIGARLGHIFTVVVGQGLRLIAIGTAIGLACSLLANCALRGFLYGVQPSDPLSFFVVTIVLTVSGLLACSLPALRAAKTDPIRALRDQ